MDTKEEREDRHRNKRKQPTRQYFVFNSTCIYLTRKQMKEIASYINAKGRVSYKSILNYLDVVI